MAQPRVYVDTSVFGGYFDQEYREDSEAFFNQAGNGRFRLTVSEYVLQELEPAPERVRLFFSAIEQNADWLRFRPEVEALAEAYISRKVLGPASRSDALHVAIATVHRCAGLVSWNFKHIVNPNKGDAFNVVNALMGYPALFITTPKGVITHVNQA